MLNSTAQLQKKMYSFGGRPAIVRSSIALYYYYFCCDDSPLLITTERLPDRICVSSRLSSWRLTGVCDGCSTWICRSWKRTKCDSHRVRFCKIRKLWIKPQKKNEKEIVSLTTYTHKQLRSLTRTDHRDPMSFTMWSWSRPQSPMQLTFFAH